MPLPQHQIAQRLGHGSLCPKKAGRAHRPDRQRRHRPTRSRRLQPAPDPAGRVARWQGPTEQPALDPGFSVEMAARRLGQAFRMVQRAGPGPGLQPVSMAGRRADFMLLPTCADQMPDPAVFPWP